MESTTRCRAGLAALVTLGLVMMTDVNAAFGDGATAAASVVGSVPVATTTTREAATRVARMLGVPGPGHTNSAAAPKRPQIDPLPGFADAPGIYHHGALDFFLGRPEQIGLTPAQQAALVRIRDAAERRVAEADQKIARAEEEVFGLTAASRPDAGAIAAKIGEIEALRSRQRLSFIRDVGEAARVLTDEQRTLVVGADAAAPAPPPPPVAPTSTAAPAVAPPASRPVAPRTAAAPKPVSEADPFDSGD